ncbi:hypothetical protein [Haloplanus sp.]|uniref:hypothetical protein n=1 Tax=Haloplanus sp. TaxID=1961696 RepID=UPI00263A3A1E|nr:hypothetical protein [Haloplanus sp.]
MDFPDTLRCSACGDPITGAGYLPAAALDDGYDPHPADAVCDACGFNDVGMMGCAPELNDVTGPGPADVLLYVRTTADGVEIVDKKA